MSPYASAGIKGILTESRKRMYKQIRQITKHKVTQVDEKDPDETKNPWGALSESWGMNDVVEDDFLPKNGVKDQGRSIKERLGIKCTEKEATQATEESGEASSSSSDSEEDWCKRSKIPRMRMHADDEEEKVQKRRAKLRYQVSRFLKRKAGYRLPLFVFRFGASRTLSVHQRQSMLWFYGVYLVIFLLSHFSTSLICALRISCVLSSQMALNNLNNTGDLRSRLGKPRTKAQFHDPIQVVVTNTKLKRDNPENVRNYQTRPILKDSQGLEREEGEWQDSEDENGQEHENEEEQRHGQRVVIEEYDEEEREEEEEEQQEHKEDEEESGEEDSDVPAKEVQGPKGSVIKVVPPKPRIASTVWARLNNVKSEISDSYLKNR